MQLFVHNQKNITVYINLLLWYSILITLPITLYYTNIFVYMIFLKNFLLPFIISAYCIYKITTISKLISFIRFVTYGSLFYSSYIIFEFFNKIFGFFPPLNRAIASYTRMTGRSNLNILSDFESTDPINIIRPLGLDINFTANGFISASGLLILLIMGRHIFNNKLVQTVGFMISYFAVLLSTSRQIIVSVHIIILILLLILIKKNISIVLFNTKIMTKVFFALVIIIFLIIIPHIPTHLYDFLSVKGGGGTGSILIGNFKSLPNNIFNNLVSHPINSIFGIGGYTPDIPGIYFKMAKIDELHFLLDIPYSMGFIGFFLYWYIIYKSGKVSWKASKFTINKQFTDIYITGILLGILFALNIIHYSPVGIFSCFFVALIPVIAVMAQKQMRHEDYILKLSITNE